MLINKFFTIPYVKNVTDRFSTIVNKVNMRAAYNSVQIE